MILHADITPQERAKSDRLPFTVSSADAKDFYAVGWFKAGAKV